MLLCLLAIGLKFPTHQQLRQAWSARYPGQAEVYLQQFHPKGNGLNDYLRGGYLIWNLHQIPVFVDSRHRFFHVPGSTGPRRSQAGFDTLQFHFDWLVLL